MQSLNDNDIHILALAGSFREGSLNQALVRAARELAPDHDHIDDLDLRTVPFYDGDLEEAGDPPGVTTLKSAVAEADALHFATPEYDGSVPAVLKNAIDWASRMPADSEGQAGSGYERQPVSRRDRTSPGASAGEPRQSRNTCRR